MFLICLFLSLFMDGVSGAGIEERVMMEGDSVTLLTNLTEILNDDTILWMFGPKDFLISQITRQQDLNSIYFTDDDRFRGRLQLDQNTGSLTLRNTRIKHSGQYKLSISRVKTTIKIFNVTVSGLAGETDGVKSLSVMEGDSVTLKTDVKVQRDDLMAWRFGDKGILLAKIDVETKEISLNDADERFRDRVKLDQTGSLIITNTNTKHSGLYELQIRGRESSQRFLLSVTAVSDPGLSPDAIAGIVCSVLLVITVLAAVVIYFHRKITALRKQIDQPTKKDASDGDSVTLKTGVELQIGGEMRWWYENDDNLIAEIKKDTRRKLFKKPYEGVDGKFRSKLSLHDTGDLTINNIMLSHSGLYKVRISRKARRTEYKRFNLTVKMTTVEVEVGGSITLNTHAEIQPGDLILWTFGAENNLVVKYDSRTTYNNERFRDRLELDETTGSLTIKNIETTDAGHFKLQIINNKQTTFKRFNVIVTGSTRNQNNESASVDMDLLHEDE